MRGYFIIGAACAALIGAGADARAASESTLTGVAIGTGALVAGPIGAVAGGVIGGVVGGPKVSHRHKHCWWDRRGVRHCRWR